MDPNATATGSRSLKHEIAVNLAFVAGPRDERATGPQDGVVTNRAARSLGRDELAVAEAVLPEVEFNDCEGVLVIAGHPDAAQDDRLSAVGHCRKVVVKVVVIDPGVPGHVRIEWPLTVRPRPAVYCRVGRHAGDGRISARPDELAGHAVRPELAMIYAVELTIAAEHHPMSPAGVAAEEELATRQPAVVRRIKQDRDLLRRAVNRQAASGGGDIQPFDSNEGGLVEADDA